MSPHSAVATPVAFSCARESLLAMVERASRVANQKPIPALDSVYLTLGPGEDARWWATDTSIWMGGLLTGVVADAPGAMLLPVSLLKGLLKSCPDGMVSLSLSQDTRLRVVVGTYKGTLPTFPVEDYPQCPALPRVMTGSFSRAEMARALTETQSALNSDHSKYFLRGALFSGDTWLSTDGHRMARARIVPSEAVEDARIVPSEAVTALSALLDRHSAETVGYVYDGERHVFTVADDVLIARTLEGQFPRTDFQFKLNRSATRASVDRCAWIAALERARATARRYDGGMSCRFLFDEQGLTLTTQSADRGESSETIAAEVTGQPLAVFLNAQYVAKFLTTTTAERVSVQAASALDSLLFQPADDREPRYDYILMPMRD